MDKKKLIEILCDNDVNVTKNNKVSLRDLVKEIIGLSKPSVYIRKLKGYKIVVIGGDKFVSINDCIDILKKSQAVRCKNICRQIFKKKDFEVMSKIDVIWLFIKFFESAQIAYIYDYVFCNETGDEIHIDFYLPDMNLALEVDDVCRFNDEIVDDLHKQICFTKLKKCEFVRVNTSDSIGSHVKLMGRISSGVYS